MLKFLLFLMVSKCVIASDLNHCKFEIIRQDKGCVVNVFNKHGNIVESFRMIPDDNDRVKACKGYMQLPDTNKK